MNRNAKRQNTLMATKHKQPNGKKIMKSKNMRTLLSLTVMSMIVVLNTPGQTLKPGRPPLQPTQPTQPVPTQPVPTQPVPTQPVPTQPVPTQPVPTQPVPTQPMPTQPMPAIP